MRGNHLFSYGPPGMYILAFSVVHWAVEKTDQCENKHFKDERTLMGLSVPVCPCPTGPLSAAISVSSSDQKGDRAMVTRMRWRWTQGCAWRWQESWGRSTKESPQGLFFAVATSLSLSQHPHDCTGQTGTMWTRKVDRQKLFPTSADLYFSLIALEK